MKTNNLFLKLLLVDGVMKIVWQRGNFDHFGKSYQYEILLPLPELVIDKRISRQIFCNSDNIFIKETKKISLGIFVVVEDENNIIQQCTNELPNQPFFKLQLWDHQ